MEERPRAAPKVVSVLRDPTLVSLIAKQIENAGPIWTWLLLFGALAAAPLLLLELALPVSLPPRISLPLAACGAVSASANRTVSIRECMLACSEAFALLPVSLHPADTAARRVLVTLGMCCSALAFLCAMCPAYSALLRGRRALRLIPLGFQVHLANPTQHFMELVCWYSAGIGALLLSGAFKLKGRLLLFDAVSVSPWTTCALIPLLAAASDKPYNAAAPIVATPTHAVLALFSLDSAVCVFLLVLLAYGLVLWLIYQRSSNVSHELQISALTPLGMELLAVKMRRRVDDSDLCDTMLHVRDQRIDRELQLSLTLQSLNENGRHMSSEASDSSDDDDSRHLRLEIDLLRRRQQKGSAAVSKLLQSLVPKCSMWRRAQGWLFRITLRLKWKLSSSFWQLDVGDDVLTPILKRLLDPPSPASA